MCYNSGLNRHASNMQKDRLQPNEGLSRDTHSLTEKLRRVMIGSGVDRIRDSKLLIPSFVFILLLLTGLACSPVEGGGATSTSVRAGTEVSLRAESFQSGTVLYVNQDGVQGWWYPAPCNPNTADGKIICRITLSLSRGDSVIVEPPVDTGGSRFVNYQNGYVRVRYGKVKGWVHESYLSSKPID